MSEGKSFHIHTPVTGKARRPTVESLAAGRDRLSVIEDWSLCREGMSAVRVNCRMYCRDSALSPLSRQSFTNLHWTELQRIQARINCQSPRSSSASSLQKSFIYTGWAKKTKPDNFCNNLVYCHPIFIIFGTYTLQEICNRRTYS